MDTVFCKAGQIVLLPLFKPATLSLWSANMPMGQLAYWVMVAARAKTTQAINKSNGELGGEDGEQPWMAYVGVVSPGEQPFNFNVLTLTHAWLVGIALNVYALACLVFLPLVVVFGIFLLPVMFAITFVFMFVPMQLGSGRLIRCLCPLLMMTRCCRSKKHNTAIESNDDASDQLDLMTLKAMGTIFFALLSASIHFTAFYYGSEGSGWTQLIDQMVELPELDVSNLMGMFENLQYVFSWPDMDVTFQVPTTMTVGVLVLQYSTELVRWLYNRYWKGYQITVAHFTWPLKPVMVAFFLGVYVQMGLVALWDVCFGCWGCWSCQGPGLLCCKVSGCFGDDYDGCCKDRCFSCCKRVFGVDDLQSEIEGVLKDVLRNSTAGSRLTKSFAGNLSIKEIDSWIAGTSK
jgi:hypothetical protein